MKTPGRASTQRRTVNAIPKSFTITDKHVAYLKHRKETGAFSSSILIREFIDREIRQNPCGFVWGEDNENS